MPNESRHQCYIYDGAPSKHLPVLAATIQRKLEKGLKCLYLNSAPMIAGARSYLASIGVDVLGEIARGRLLLSSESCASADGSFDIGKMLGDLEDALNLAIAEGNKGLFATGDMTWEFGAEKNFGKLMEYERRLEELFLKRSELCGLCQYHQDTLPKDTLEQGLQTHRTVFVNDTLAQMNPKYIPAQYPNEMLRKKLIIAGIPKTQHCLESLAAFVPDLNVKIIHGMSADTLAEVLLYFITKGFVRGKVESIFASLTTHQAVS